MPISSVEKRQDWRMSVQRSFLMIGLAAILLLIAGCSQSSYNRGDQTTIFAANTHATNKAQQIINPLPNRAYDRRIPHSGQRMSGAVERYVTGADTEEAKEISEGIVADGVETD